MASSSRLRVGILAEDQTDCETLKVLVRRILAGVGQQASFAHRAKDGCAHLRRKARVWMAELADDGCSLLLLVHDLDRNPQNGCLHVESELHDRLAEVAVPSGVRRHICIPVEELEAWFWSCPQPLERIAPGQGRSQLHPSPERLAKPKERLMHLSRQHHGGKARYTTGQNPELAALLDLDLCARRCPSFQKLQAFVTEAAGPERRP